MTDDYMFIMKRRNGRKEVFGRSKLLRFADTLPRTEVHVVDSTTRKSLGYMPIILAKKKFI